MHFGGSTQVVVVIEEKTFGVAVFFGGCAVCVAGKGAQEVRMGLYAEWEAVEFGCGLVFSQHDSQIVRKRRLW